MVLVLSIEFPRRVLRILLAGAVTETIRTMAGRGVRISWPRFKRPRLHWKAKRV